MAWADFSVLLPTLLRGRLPDDDDDDDNGDDGELCWRQHPIIISPSYSCGTVLTPAVPCGHSLPAARNVSPSPTMCKASSSGNEGW